MNSRIIKSTDKGVRKCNHILAFHIGHMEIRQSEATKETLLDNCCGGILILRFCPDCGHKNWMPAWYQVMKKEGKLKEETSF